MKERDKVLDLGALDHRDRKSLGRQRGSNSDVGRLAKLASPIILAVRVDVAGGNDNKKDGEDAESQRQKPYGVPAERFSGVPVRHAGPPYDNFDAAQPPVVTRPLGDAADSVTASASPKRTTVRRASQASSIQLVTYT
ncbi:MAG TPA: hypothetical protein VJX29_08580 [Candidatus Acidoferrales bacterium]|nr:hypothetical protein [Candidatus Acidoferrales bacterium]